MIRRTLGVLILGKTMGIIGIRFKSVHRLRKSEFSGYIFER